MLYVLDEPSVGLHQRDTAKLIELFYELRDRGNSVFVVEHDPEIISNADWEIELGPEGGKNGGYILYEGSPRK